MSRSGSISTWVFVSALLFSVVPPLLAQSSTGEIDVTVMDESDAIISDAKVSITGSDTGALVRTVATNSAGLAAVPLLNPGTYNVKVEKEGFKTLIQQGVVLRVTETVALRIKMELGATVQSVTVSGEVPLVDTTSNAQGQVVNNQTMTELPLNGRNYLQLSVLTAGTVPSANKDASFSAFGNRGMQNVYMLDGGLNESYIRGIDNHQRDAMRPSLEAIQEFKVQTGNYSAEYGSSAGGVVSVVTKSGTNEIHGSAFDFMRNNAIAARDFFAPPGPKPQLILNQFGGAMGGPIKKNRAWIFGAYQGTEIRQQNTFISSVPTAANENGVFTTPIFDPTTTVASGSTFTRSLFPNNTIPASDFNSIGKQLAAMYPDPNRPGLGNNYIRNASLPTVLHNATFRGDVQVTPKDTMFGRLGLNRSNLTVQAALPEPAQTAVAQELPAWNFGYGYTRVFSPTLVNEFRFAWTRPEITKDATQAKNEIIPNALAPGVDSGMPLFSVTGFAELGQQPPGYQNNPLAKSSAVWEFSDNATKNFGNHTLKFGFTHQYLKFYTLATLNGRGHFTMDGSYTQNPQSRGNTGSGLADLLLGYAQSAVSSSVGVSNLRAQNDFAYVQDDWKITPRLTLNLGLRYELYWPITDIDNKLGNFVLNPADPAFGTLVYAGVGGYSSSLMTVDKNNFAPRIGFAYRVPHTGDLTLRGGYGMFYGNPDEQTGVGNMMTNNPPFVGAGSVNLIGDRNFPATAFNLSGSLPATVVVSPKDYVFNRTSTSTLFSWPTYYRAPVVHQWNLSVEKQLPSSIMVEVSYVGNANYGLWGSFPDNQPVTPGPGAIPARRKYAAYTLAPVTGYGPWSRGHYEGLITRVEKRMTKGLYFLGSFTFSRAIDLSSGVGLDGCAYCGTQEAIQNPNNLAAQRGPSSSNTPRRFVFSATWDVPLGYGQHYLSTGFISHIVGGWQASGIWSVQDGTPFTLQLSFDNANTGTTNWPNRVCDGRLANPALKNWFDQSCFIAAPQYTFGNAGRNELYGPAIDNIDFAIHRFFPIPLRETMKLEFRAEMYNFFNHPEFGMPVVNLGLPQTGQITGTNPNIPNRQVQLALKLMW